MASRVEIAPNAEADIDGAYNWIKLRDSEAAAAKWMNGLSDAINALVNLPSGYPLADEGRKFKVEIRQHLYGNRRSGYRILFQNLKDKDGPFVRVLRDQHSSRQSLRFDELHLN